MNVLYDADGITVIHGRCEDVLPTLEHVDHVIADPPYSEHVHTRQGRGRVLDTQYPCRSRRDTDLGFKPLSPRLMRFCAGQFARLTRRWVLVFSDVEHAVNWRKAMEKHTLEYVRTGAWVKVGGAPQFTGDRPAVGFEAITIMHPKGRKRWNGGGLPALWTYPIVANRDGKTPRLHTAQKPLSLITCLVEQFTNRGDLVLDSFAGSGTTGVACRILGRRAILVEQDRKYAEIAAERIAAVNPLPLADVAEQAEIELV